MRRKDTLTADLFGETPAAAVASTSPPSKTAPVAAVVQPAATPLETQARARLRAGREALKTVPPEPIKSTSDTNQRYTVSSIASISPMVESPRDSPISPPPEPPRTPITLFPLVAFIAFGCFALSSVNTFLFLLRSGKPILLAATTAVLTTAFSGAAFHFGKTYRNFFFYALASFIIAFSVFASLAVSYDQLKAQEIASATALEYLRQTAALRSVNVQELETAQAEIIRLTQRTADLQNQADYWQAKSWNRYDAARAELTATESRIAEVQARITALQAESRRIAARDADTARVRGNTVYSFVAAVSGVDENILRFLVFCIPAVFFDLASPLMLALLWRNRR